MGASHAPGGMSMDSLAVAAAAPNTMTPNALAFMLLAWAAVLTLTGWAFARLLKAPPTEQLPPPGSIP
jgi:hypothetical protein